MKLTPLPHVVELGDELGIAYHFAELAARKHARVLVAELGDCCFRPLQNLRVFSGGLARLGKKTRKVVAMERHDQISSVVGRQYYAAPVVLCKALQNSRYRDNSFTNWFQFRPTWVRN